MSSPQHSNQSDAKTQADTAAKFNLDSLPEHAELWKLVQSISQSERLAQTFLLIGSSGEVISFVHRWVAMLMCQAIEKPCGECLSCRRFKQGIPADVCIIQPDGTGPIKIDQIRALLEDIYQTPQCGLRRYVIIEAADQLNVSSANALLKLLEEPPEHAMFFLLVKHISDLPVTLVSRCQRLLVPEGKRQSMEAQIESQTTWFDDFFSLVCGKTSACVLADTWSKYPLLDVVTWLYRLTAFALKVLRANYPSSDRIRQLIAACPEKTWFNQLLRIHETSKCLHQRMNLNTTLTLNYLLIGYCDAD